MANDMRADLEKLVQRLREAFDDYAREGGMFDESTPSRPHPPAAVKEIDAFEKKMGWKFPASYRDFLTLHNGWERYASVFTLIGVGGKHTTKAQKQIKETLSLYKGIWEEKHGKATDARIKEFESKANRSGKTEDDARIYIANKLVFGTSSSGSLRLFNPAVTDKAGEPEVVYRDQLGEIVRRYPNFRAMLEADLAFYEGEVASQKKEKKA